MVVRQNILSTIILKNDKLFCKNFKLHLATPAIYQARDLSSNARIPYLLIWPLQPVTRLGLS